MKNRPKTTWASVDWLTITAKTPRSRDDLLQCARQALDQARLANLPVRSWKWCGYSGWLAEGFRVGSRADSDVVMISGPTAARYWKDFAGMGENVTRLDLAVTLELDKPDDLVLINYWDECEELKSRLGKPKYRFTLLYNSEGGQTLYVGQRSSSQMGRIYDKGVEAGNGAIPGAIWRYEVELKKPRALPICRQLYEMRDADDVGRIIANYVHKWFADHRVKAHFPVGENVLITDVEVVATSDEARLRWLSTQVRPSCVGLADRGKLEDVVKALGLEGHVQLRQWNLDAESGNR